MTATITPLRPWQAPCAPDPDPATAFARDLVAADPETATAITRALLRVLDASVVQILKASRP
jgi:hypothetical protein